MNTSKGQINHQKTILSSLSLIVLSMLACNAAFTVGYPTPTTAPPTEVPTGTSTWLSDQVSLVSQPYTETGQDPVYSITAQIPQLTGSDDPRVPAFNQFLEQGVQREISVFREEFTRGPVMEVTTNSFLEVTYLLVAQYDDVWSFKFFYNFYNNGAAHPGEFSRTVNYNLELGQEILFTDIFLPDSNYLEVISNYCMNELRKQPFADSVFIEGASPTFDHYRNWNISPEGFMVTFDSYQVAPGAAGPQIITIPYAELNSVIDPQGPLSKFIQ